MFYTEDGQWNSVEGPELEGFLTQVGTIDGKHATSPMSTKVSWRSLPYYDQVALVRVQDESWDPSKLTVYFLTNQGKLTRLDGTSPPIHMINAEAPIKVTEENVLEYLQFFCFFVRGEDGPFLIAEDMDNPALPQGMDEQTLKVVEGTLRPATYEGKNEQGHFLCDGIVFYSNALFIANFAVEPTGMIQMLDDDPVAADLPVRVDMPIA
jgi:hypothetical protein